MIVFLEPNPFASRLHVLSALVSGAAKRGDRVVVIRSGRESGADLTEFESMSSFETVVPQRSQQRARSRIRFAALVGLLREARRLVGVGSGSTVVLTALDDYVPAAFPFSVLVRLVLPRARVIAVRYRVQDLLPGSGLARWVKRALFTAARVLGRQHVVIFDERVAPSPVISVLPDPWDGPFGSESRHDARRALGWHGDETIVSLIGFQDARKGFDIAAAALGALSIAVRVLVVGRIDTDFAEVGKALSAQYGERFVHVADYISDEELARYLAASSMVLVPYHREFTSSSGLLVRAAASATPVVASDHGLVGDRVRRHGLGLTFAFPDAQSLAAGIARLAETGFDPAGALAYARASTSATTAERFAAVLTGEAH